MFIQKHHYTIYISNRHRKKSQKKKLDEIRYVKLEKMREGMCIQILHIGPYEMEHRTLQKIEQYMKENNLVKNGLNHEIYLSDPRKTPPQRLKTILRVPVKRISGK